MATTKHLVIGTENGVYLSACDGESLDAHPVGLGEKGTIRSLLVDHRDPNRLYATTNYQGIWRSDNGGADWKGINEGIYNRQGFCVAQHRETGELYYGCEPASVFKSSDDGESWQICQGLQKLAEREDWTFPGPPYVPHVKHLALCDEDPEIIYGAVEEGWVIRSRDGGLSWQNLCKGSEFDAHTVTVMPTDPNIVIQTSGKGAYRSDDAGENFQDANHGLDHRYLAHLIVHPDRPDTLFTAGASVPPPHWRRPEGPGAGIYRSDDQAKTWRRLEGGLPDDLGLAAPRATAGDPTDPDGFYVGLTDGRIWETVDGGESFRNVAAGLPPVLAIAVATGLCG